uniref:Uncharacterized protein n=1 Tax=Avena sativa TaxID=4498 RepID=A0ACD5ZWL7_AVESA
MPAPYGGVGDRTGPEGRVVPFPTPVAGRPLSALTARTPTDRGVKKCGRLIRCSPLNPNPTPALLLGSSRPRSHSLAISISRALLFGLPHRTQPVHHALLFSLTSLHSPVHFPTPPDPNPASELACPLRSCRGTAHMALPPLLLRLHLLFLLLGSRAVWAGAALHDRDAAALRDVRASLRDLPGSRFFDSWDDGDGAPTPCTYAGVVCAPDEDDPSGALLRVSVLTLGSGLSDSPGLAGTLPASLASLTALTDLVLYPGRVGGSIPADIGSGLRRLRLLSLSGNRLTGQVPDSLAGLPDLHTLDLGNNRLEGAIPSGLLLPSSPSLKVLILANNVGLSGEIPAQFSSSQLFHVDLGRNSITGALPPLPPTLRYFSVAANSMEGSLDGAFAGDGNAPADLAFLDLSMNDFSGPIPPQVFALPSASSLLLSRNNFTGPLAVPASPASSTPPWSVVDVSHNAISGEVPEALAAAGSLYVNNNKISGEVPEAVAHSVFAGRMTTFYAQHNFLTGFPVPSRPLPDSAALCLSYNCMDLPSASAADGCPTIGGPLEARPADQCRSGGGDG